MTGIDRIKQRILEDAQKEADLIVQTAQHKADALKAAKAGEAGKLKKRLTEENMEAAREHKRRLLTVAQLEMRKKVLAAKQEMIDAVFMGVLQRIESMPDDEYKDIIMSMLLASPLYGDEEVVFSACDPHNLDQGFLNKVNEMLAKDGRKGQLRLSSDRGQFKAGFILRREGVEINSTFESILGTLRNDMEPLLAEILFA